MVDRILEIRCKLILFDFFFPFLTQWKQFFGLVETYFFSNASFPRVETVFLLDVL